MNKITPEEIYQEFHRQTFFYSRNIYPKPIKNFSNIKSSDDWIYFQRFADKIEQNDGLVNYKMFIESLAQHYKGWFDPKILLSLKGIKIYKIYKDILNSTNDSDLIYSGITNSIKNIVMFCKDNNIKTFDEYFNHNKYTIPTLLKHLYAGSISHYTLLLIDNISDKLRTFPSDMINEYLQDFNNNKELNFSRMSKFGKIRSLYGKIEKIVDIEINKRKEDNKAYERANIHQSL